LEGPGKLGEKMQKNVAKRPTPFIARERSKGTWEDDTNIRNLLLRITQETAYCYVVSMEILRKEKEP